MLGDIFMKRFIILLAFSMIFLSHHLAFAGTCTSTVINVDLSDDNGKLMTTMSWFGNHQTAHYICDYSEATCKSKYALLLTAFALHKRVAYTYTNHNCGDGTNLTSIYPDRIKIFND